MSLFDLLERERVKRKIDLIRDPARSDGSGHTLQAAGAERCAEEGL